MPKRHHARLIAFQIEYSLGYNPQTIEEAARLFRLLEKERKKPLPEFALNLVRVVREHLEELDAEIDGALQNWRPERLAAAERAVLRLGCAELLYFEDVPHKVTLDEYVELAREFGDDASSAFVNGILDAIRKKHNIVKNHSESHEADSGDNEDEDAGDEQDAGDDFVEDSEGNIIADFEVDTQRKPKSPGEPGAE